MALNYPQKLRCRLILEEAFKEAEEDFLVELLTPLRELEALLQNQ